MDATFFKTHMIAKGMSATELARLGSVVVELPVKAGEKLCVEGAESPGLCLIRAGAVKVTKLSGKSERTVARFDAPTVLGELELISGRPCLASVVAESDVEAYLLTPLAFESLLNAGDTVATKITRNIARVVIERLADTSKKLVSLMNS